VSITTLRNHPVLLRCILGMSLVMFAFRGRVVRRSTLLLGIPALKKHTPNCTNISLPRHLSCWASTRRRGGH